jgi:DHA1 family bicyclomycin/chloramphenicol resistance-like MFS transporter
MVGFIILMASLMSVVAISIDAMLPALGFIGADLGVTNPNQAQYIIAILFGGMAIGQLIYGPMSDAVGRKKVLYTGLAFYALGSVVCYLSQDLNQMLIGRFIQGFGIASPYVSTMAIIRDKYSGRDMARIMSLVMVIFILVPCIAPTLGQTIIMFSSWRMIFVFYIVMIAAMTAYIFFRLEETLRPENRVKFSLRNLSHGFKVVFSNRHTVGYTVCMGLVFGSFMGYLNSSQQIFQVQFNTGKLFTLYFGCLAFLFGVSSLVNSYFVQRLGMRHICLRGTIATIIASSIFLGLNLTMEIHLWMFLIYAAVLFFVFGLMFGNLNSLAMEPMGEIAGLAASVIGFISTIISMTIGAVIGQMYDNTLVPISAGFLIAGVFSLLAMWWAEKGKMDF